MIVSDKTLAKSVPERRLFANEWTKWSIELYKWLSFMGLKGIVTAVIVSNMTPQGCRVRPSTIKPPVTSEIPDGNQPRPAIFIRKVKGIIETL
jgi:hypothetical protein